LLYLSLLIGSFLLSFLLVFRDLLLSVVWLVILDWVSDIVYKDIFMAVDGNIFSQEGLSFLLEGTEIGID